MPAAPGTRRCSLTAAPRLGGRARLRSRTREDPRTTFTLPHEWHQYVQPRRGGRYQPAVTPDPAAADTFTARLTKAMPTWDTPTSPGT
ncbi:hypothetical protein GCM10029964_057840 [Kibdelosporangium lantanae]